MKCCGSLFSSNWLLSSHWSKGTAPGPMVQPKHSENTLNLHVCVCVCGVYYKSAWTLIQQYSHLFFSPTKILHCIKTSLSFKSFESEWLSWWPHWHIIIRHETTVQIIDHVCVCQEVQEYQWVTVTPPNQRPGWEEGDRMILLMQFLLGARLCLGSWLRRWSTLSVLLCRSDLWFFGLTVDWSNSTSLLTSH